MPKPRKPWTSWKPFRVNGLTMNRICLTTWGCDANPGGIDAVSTDDELDWLAARESGRNYPGAARGALAI